MAKTALITGVTGQDGSYLTELLLEKGYTVHGMIRNGGRETTARIEHLLDDIYLDEADLREQSRISRIVRAIQPDEIYNLAAQTFIPASWEEPIDTTEATALGVVRMLEAIRNECPTARFFQAGSSEMFGAIEESPQSENTAFRPRNPYAASKVYGHWITVNYRDRYDLYACSGILFNHESPRRGADFVTRKITRTAAMIKLGMADELKLGNLQARRDWGYAGDYVRAMWQMLQQDKPVDYVIGTGVANRVEDFVRAAFSHLGLDWNQYVSIDPRFYRPAEPHQLVADPTRANQELGWQPEVTLDQLVAMMVDADMELLKSKATPVKNLASGTA
jgi:GDPmannose 4,6-dehydratase